jgi:hypothetical protein
MPRRSIPRLTVGGQRALRLRVRKRAMCCQRPVTSKVFGHRAIVHDRCKAPAGDRCNRVTLKPLRHTSNTDAAAADAMHIAHPLKRLALLAAAALLSACSGPAAVVGLIGMATDTSASWAIVKHFHDKWVEGGPVPCYRMDSLERALSAHCQPHAAGTIKAADLAAPHKLPLCPLGMAARDPRLWHVLPELIEKGAMPEACARAPLVELAQADPCPDFTLAPPKVRESMLWLAQADARAVHHDVVRMLSCPKAREVGFDQAIARWAEQGQMPVGRLSFSPLSALHPDMLATPLAARLEADGHTARAGLDPYQGTLRSGFEEAFRSGHFEALDWWLARAPELANRVPPPQGNQVPWVPLAKTLSNDWLDQPAQQQQMVSFLLARGANPAQRLPHQPEMTVLRLARQMNSPLLPMLESAPVPSRSRVAAGGRSVPGAP